METKQLKYLGKEYIWGRKGYGNWENLILLCNVKGVIDKWGVSAEFRELSQLKLYVGMTDVKAESNHNCRPRSLTQ